MTGADIAVVLTVTDWLVFPVGTVMLAGTDACGSELLRLTTAPPGGAGAVSVTVAVVTPPPVTGFGFRLSMANYKIA